MKLLTYCDVGSSHPGAAVRSKGWAVRPLKWYVSWVQNVSSKTEELRRVITVR